MTQEALKLALEALEADELDMVDDGSGNMIFRKEQVITAIKEALAQEQEPVAWEQFHEHMAGPFYTAPPQRTWLGLTDEERQEIALEVPIDAVLMTEAKLKEKNT